MRRDVDTAYAMYGKDTRSFSKRSPESHILFTAATAPESPGDPAVDGCGGVCAERVDERMPVLVRRAWEG